MSAEKSPSRKRLRTRGAGFMLGVAGLIMPVTACSEIEDTIGTGMQVDNPCYAFDAGLNDIDSINIVSKKGFDSGEELVVVRDVTDQVCIVVQPKSLYDYHSNVPRFMGLYKLDPDTNKIIWSDEGEYTRYTDPIKLNVGETATIAAFASSRETGKADSVGVELTIANELDNSSEYTTWTVSDPGSYEEFLNR